ncbi:MAG: hypothetical protein J1E61_00190 [Lachnospiraceae bacterium]|nr:hypothetical protein [Lachnospiraceae bacterium]
MLIIQPIGGLCNRMRAINSARILSQKRGDRLTVIWFVNRELGCPFEKIFCPTDAFKVINIYSKWDIKKLFYQGLSFLFGIFVNNEWIRSNREEGSLTDASVSRLGTLITYIATEEHFYPCHDYSPFVPVDTVQKRIDSLKQSLGKSSIGVHIRRTDNLPSIGKSSTESFISSMKEALSSDPETVFYLATDDIEEEKRLREQFPGKIISNEDRDLSRDSIAGIQDAMIDLYCLASTSKIIGSYFSSFTDIAADMHDIPKIIAGA